MRRLLSPVAAALRVAAARVRAHAARLAALQGIAGVCCATAGAYVIAGVGVALLVLGAFLLLGAWADR